MIEIALKDIEKSFSIEKILDSVSFEIKKGERIALIGKNGTGKTTIFKIISGIETYDNGSIMIRKDTTIGYLDQIPNYPKQYKVSDVLNLAFEEVFNIKLEMEELEHHMANCKNELLEQLTKKYGNMQVEFERLDGYAIQEKLNKICTGLKISNKFRQRAFENLSGGEKTTVVLAKMLLQNPDILLLDEPTNHLDIESVEWLEEFLKDYSGTVLIISHDRYFLDKVVTKIYEIENKKINVYNGNYSYYIEEKQRRFDEQQQKYKNQQKKINQMEDAIKRFRDWGTRSDDPRMFKKAANMQKRIEKMDKIEKPNENKKMDLAFSNTHRSANQVITINDLVKKFDENIILNKINFEVRYGETIGIIGKNGSGKTTLLKTILGKYEPDNGEIKIGSRAKIGYLEQVINFKNENNTILDEFRYFHPMPQTKARSVLSKFLFYGDDVFKNIKVLSGGEKVRLKLCILMHDNVNLLVLDEPTNHLDIDSREMLEKALKEFDGTIIFISHDRYFLNKFSQRTIQIINSNIRIFHGNYDYFKQKSIEQNNVDMNISKPKKREFTNYNKSKQDKKSKNMLKRIENLEKEIEYIETQILQKDMDIANSSCNYEKLKQVYDEKNKLIHKRDLLLEEWTELCE